MSSSAPRPDQHRSGPDSSPSSDSSRDPEASRRTGEATAERGFLARAGLSWSLQLLGRPGDEGRRLALAAHLELLLAG